MREAVLDVISQTIVLGIELGLAAILTTLGVFSEQIGVTSINHGDMIGFWYIYIGAIALYAGVYVLGYERILPALKERLAAV